MATKWKFDTRISRVRPADSGKSLNEVLRGINNRLVVDFKANWGVPERLVDGIRIDQGALVTDVQKLREKTREALGYVPYDRTNKTNASHFNMGRSSFTTLGSAAGKSARVNMAAFDRIQETYATLVTLHEGYYRGLLKAVDGILANPGIDMNTGGNIPFSRQLRVRSQGTGVDKVRNANLMLNWRALSEITLKAKNELGDKRSLSFWRHTGFLAAAYHRHMLDQYARLRKTSFVGRVTTKRESAAVSGTSFKLKGEYYRRVSVRTEIGIPLWDTLMDRVLTYPFATGDVLQGLNNHDKTFRDNKGKFVAIDGQLHTGIARILAPESHRPLVGPYSVAVSKLLYKDIKQVKTSYSDL